VTTVPEDLVTIVDAHGKAVASADNRAVLGDFLPDRVGQLIASADVPTELEGSQVRSITATGDGSFDAIIRYTTFDDDWFELRSRWLQYDGSWRVVSVRNIPDTAPWMDLTGPSPDGLDEPHWTALRTGRLKLQRCNHCHTWTWSPRPICPACHSFDMGWEDVEPAGTVYSWTRTWQPFAPESTGHLPYVVVLVELAAAGGSRVMGVLAHADGHTPRIGDRVVGVIEQPPDDLHWPLVRWHRVDGAG
jgi:uncharacterized protein